MGVLLGVAVWASPASGATAEGILWCGGVTHQTANFRVEAQDSEDVFVLHTDSTFPLVGAVARIPVVGGVTAIDMAPLRNRHARTRCTHARPPAPQASLAYHAGGRGLN